MTILFTAPNRTASCVTCNWLALLDVLFSFVTSFPLPYSGDSPTCPVKQPAFHLVAPPLLSLLYFVAYMYVAPRFRVLRLYWVFSTCIAPPYTSHRSCWLLQFAHQSRSITQFLDRNQYGGAQTRNRGASQSTVRPFSLSLRCPVSLLSSEHVIPFIGWVWHIDRRS